jgi:hypothetical protein
MSGILNSKSRILDVIVTQEGRRQIANGDIRIKFASFTDCHTYYEASAISGSADASSRLFFEAASLPHDQITFETDDSGNMVKFSGADIEYDGDRIFTGDSDNRLSEVTDTSKFASSVSSLLNSSVQNFQKHMMIGTKDDHFGSQQFNLNQNSYEFKINSTSPINTKVDLSTAGVDEIEPFFLDKRLSHLPSFKFLPPVNSYDGEELAEFSDLNEGHNLTLEQLKKELKEKPYVDIEFQETSHDNNIMAQFFETKYTSMTKLDAIDFGEFIDRDGEECRVFFVGKVFSDKDGIPTFVNMFTMVYGIDGFDNNRNKVSNTSSIKGNRKRIRNSSPGKQEDDL